MATIIEARPAVGARHALLRCAGCRALLKVGATAWTCGSCGAAGPCTLGIPDLRPAELRTPDGPREIDQIAVLSAAYPTATFNDLVELRVPYFSTDDPALTSHYAAYRQGSMVRGARYYAMAMERLRETVGEPDCRLAVVLGCGAGSCTLAVAAEFDVVIAVDPGLADLILARKACEEHGCQNVVLVQGYAQRLPLAGDVVDLVISEDVIEHVFDLESTMAESARVLAPGGCVVGNSANRFSVLRPEPHVKLWGVGFLPRRWMGRYVRWRRGYHGYDTSTYLPSYRELLGAVRRSFGSSGRIVFPRVAAWDFPKAIDRLVQRVRADPADRRARPVPLSDASRRRPQGEPLDGPRVEPPGPDPTRSWPAPPVCAYIGSERGLPPAGTSRRDRTRRMIGLPCQRALFDIPEGVAYLNCAYLSPLLRSVHEVGKAALARKVHPWTIVRPDFYDDVERARARFARLIGAAADDIAIVSSTSYGTAVAGANLPVARGQSVLVLADQHASNVLQWHRLAGASGGDVRTVPRPADGDWTTAVLERLDRTTAIAALPNVHWTDGGLLDLVAIGRRCRELGAALVIDGTQSVGAMPLDVREVQPDFLVVSAYKWLLCPYTLGFLYAAPHRQDGRPIEEHGQSRQGAATAEGKTGYTFDFAPGARRYDMGERCNFINLPMAITAMDQLIAWGPPAIAATLAGLTAQVAAEAESRGFFLPPAAHRAPHLLGFRSADGFSVDTARQLAAEGVHVSLRGGALRVSPHLYNDEADVGRLFAVLDRITGRRG